MGEFQNWQPQPNGFSIEDELFPPSSITSLSSSSSVNPNPLSIGDECWSVAEQRTKEIICRIQPTVVSEQRRKVVTEYVQRLIRNRLGSEVFPFGSVPLKTYLPDGDIDLTALSYQNVEDALANDVRNVLEVEERNNAAEFIVKDVQYINAEVKLVKCLVQNIVVDISFNQVGGLSTLCFLEKVDQLIRKDNLFKRSIILIKAWCYYESRILGAHHGLISTYALETLVLYIFHLFHSSLNGPLAVLYRFLDYYSKFDWDNYCISLNGPVSLASLPEIVAETPENGGDGLLLSKEFLKSCADTFSVPSKGLEMNARSFPQKHLNIVDPLKENNNLGRSVSKGNFYRIRSAFTYGARKLGRILLIPGESIGDELNNFFMNTLDRHGSGQRPDVQDPVPFSGANEPNPRSSKSGTERCASSRNASVLPFVCFNGTTDKAVLDPPELLGTGISDIRISGVEENPGIEFAYEPQKHNAVVGTSLRSEIGVQNGISVSQYRLGGDAKDHASFRNHSQRNASETEQDASSSVRRAYDASHVYISHSPRENAKISSLNLARINSTNTGILDNKPTTSMLPRPPEEQNGHVSLGTNATTNDPIRSHCDNVDSITFSSADCTLISGRSATISEEACHSSSEADPVDTDGALNTLSDLTGDYNSHLRSLQYGQWFHGGFYGPPMPIPPPPPSQFRNKHGWDSFHQQMSLKHNVFPHMSANGVVSGHQFYPPNSSINSGATFGVEEIPKPRGTGTYFPNMNHRSYRDKPMPGKGRNPAPATHGNMQRPHRENGWPVTPSETNTNRESESIQRHFPVFSNRETSEPVEFHQAGHPGVRGFPHSNGFSQPEKLRSENVGHLPLASPPVDSSKQPSSSAPQTQVSPSSLPALTTERPKPSLSIDTERIAVESYHLRDDDFPPLSV